MPIVNAVRSDHSTEINYNIEDISISTGYIYVAGFAAIDENRCSYDSLTVNFYLLITWLL